MSEEEQPYEEVTTGQEKPVKKGIVEEIQEMKEKGEINTAAYKDKIKQFLRTTINHAVFFVKFLDTDNRNNTLQ